jgi:flagellar biosynthetic protein FliR
VVVSRYLNTLAMLAFLVFDGHLQLIAALITTFQSVPVDVNVVASASHAQGWRVMVGYGASVFSTGLLLSLPVVAALLIANLALGILNRAAPQIGIFQVGFPVTMLVGLLLLQLMVPNLMPFFQRIFEAGLGQVGRIAGSMGS